MMISTNQAHLQMKWASLLHDIHHVEGEYGHFSCSEFDGEKYCDGLVVISKLLALFRLHLRLCESAKTASESTEVLIMTVFLVFIKNIKNEMAPSLLFSLVCPRS